MPIKLTWCTLTLLSALLVGCEDNRTAAFCDNVCECFDGEAQNCAAECTQRIESIENTNFGPPIVSDACFACVDHNSCQDPFAVCGGECARLIETFENGQQPEPQPGDPLDTN